MWNYSSNCDSLYNRIFSNQTKIMKHTKGKWSISGSGNKDFKLCIVAEDRGSICHITNWSEARANANVIAKVPEMIEALKKAQTIIGKGIGIAWDESDLREFINASEQIESLLKELES